MPGMGKERGKVKTIYLGGPIDGVTPEWATEWRKRVAKELPQHKVLDPCEGKDLYHPECNTTLYTSKEIVETDLWHIDQADILLVDWRDTTKEEWSMDYTRPPLMVGTICEMWEAHRTGKQVISFGDLRRGYWKNEATDKHFDTLEDAIEHLKGAS